MAAKPSLMPSILLALGAAIGKSLIVRVPRLYVRGDWFSSIVARAMSLALAFTALVLAAVFLAVLPASGGRLALGDGLAFRRVSADGRKLLRHRRQTGWKRSSLGDVAAME